MRSPPGDRPSSACCRPGATVPVQLSPRQDQLLPAELAARFQLGAALPQLHSPYLVRVHETGQAAGRGYELMEYLPGGNLRARTGRRFDTAMITEVVRQLSAGLAALHAANITHRDIKPENVLLRSDDQMEFVLTDFGLSRHAFPVDDVADPRLRLLCRGLLVHDFESRWGLGQVQGWLTGQSPPVPQHRGPADQPTSSVRPFLFMGEHWNDLRAWLTQFDDPDRFDVAGRREMVDELSDPGSADPKLLRLLAWLGPTLPPNYRGFSLAPRHVLSLAVAEAEQIIRDREIAARQPSARRTLWQQRERRRPAGRPRSGGRWPGSGSCCRPG